MPYLKRNSAGEVVALMAVESNDAREWASPDSPEVLLFLAGVQPGSDGGNANKLEMLAADLSLIRVIEDVIDILIDKNIIIFSELPAPVQEKLLRKKGQREKLFGVGDILSSDEGLL